MEQYSVLIDRQLGFFLFLPASLSFLALLAKFDQNFLEMGLKVNFE